MKNVPWKEVPDDNILPDAIVLATLEQMAKGETKANDNSPGGKLMYTLNARIKAPKTLKGMQLFDRYVVGTDDDPDAEEVDTIRSSIGVKRMKRMLKAAGADLDSNAPPLKVFGSVKGKDVLFEVSKKKRTEGRFKGQYSNDVVAVYAPGEEEPRLLDAEGEEEEPRRPRRAPAPSNGGNGGRAAAAEESEGEGEDAGEAERPRGRRIARPAPAEPEPAGEGEEEVEGEPEEKPAPARAAKAGKASAKKSDVVKCSACGKLVERDKFDDHLEEEHAED